MSGERLLESEFLQKVSSSTSNRMSWTEMMLIPFLLHI